MTARTRPPFGRQSRKMRAEAGVPRSHPTARNSPASIVSSPGSPAARTSVWRGSTPTNNRRCGLPHGRERRSPTERRWRDWFALRSAESPGRGFAELLRRSDNLRMLSYQCGHDRPRAGGRLSRTQRSIGYEARGGGSQPRDRARHIYHPPAGR